MSVSTSTPSSQESENKFGDENGSAAVPPVSVQQDGKIDDYDSRNASVTVPSDLGRPDDTKDNDSAKPSNEQKMKNILKGAHREMKPEVAAKMLQYLVEQIPLDVVQPLFRKANDEFNRRNKNKSGKILNIGKFSNILEMEDKSNVESNEIDWKGNEIITSILNVLSSLSSEHISKLEVLTLVRILKLASTKLDFTAENCFAVRNIENSLTWQARNCSITELCSLLSFSLKRKSECGGYETTIKLFDEVAKSLERRWVEIVNAKEFVSLMHYYPDHFSDQFASKIEDRIAELVEAMMAEDLASILKVLGTKKRRNLPLLRALSYHLVKRRSELSAKLLSDCMFALNQLNFKDTGLLEGLCDAAEQKVALSDIGEISVIKPEQQVMLARSMLTSLGQLKFRHQGLLDGLCTLMTAKLEGGENIDGYVKNRDLTTFLLTTATLDYCPQNSEKLYEAAIQNITQSKLEEDLQGKSEVMWLNIVWSMTILKKASHHHFESVLSSEFYNKLLYSHDHRNVHVILKLLNVNAVASLESTYKGPTIDIVDDPLLRDVKSAPTKDKATFIAMAMDDFSKFACPPNFLVPNINTLMGFQIEGEAVFDKHGKSLPIEGISIFTEDSTINNQPKALPEGATR